MNHWYHAVWVLRSRHYLVYNLRRWAFLLCVDVNSMYVTIGFLCLQFSYARKYFKDALVEWEEIDLSEFDPDDD